MFFCSDTDSVSEQAEVGVVPITPEFYSHESESGSHDNIQVYNYNRAAYGPHSVKLVMIDT